MVWWKGNMWNNNKSLDGNVGMRFIASGLSSRSRHGGRDSSRPYKSRPWRGGRDESRPYKSLFIWGGDHVARPYLFQFIVIIGALLVGGVLGYINPVYGAACAGGLFMVIVCLLRQDELAMAILISVHLYVDLYIGLHIVAPLMAIILLLFYYISRSSEHPWIGPKALWLWALFLLLTISPAIKGAWVLYDVATYYPSDILGALLMFWIGILLARNGGSLRRLFQWLGAMGALFALHTIIQATLGITILGTSHYDAVLLQTANFQIWNTNAHRYGSFFIDPNWNGTFLGMLFFLPFGLLVSSRSLLGKAVYLCEMCLIVLAIMFTYSIGAWVSLSIGVATLLVFVGRMHYRVLLPILCVIAVGLLILFFPAQIASLLVHTQEPDEVPLRVGAWLTALRIISVYPWTGIGLGYQSYLVLSDPFRVPQEYFPLAHPHNSYLEWGAMAGLPVLAIFMSLLVYSLWLSMRNWLRSDYEYRPVIGAGIAAIITLSVNSWTINAWTNPVLAMLGWLILGALASPLLTKWFAQRHPSKANKNLVGKER